MKQVIADKSKTNHFKFSKSQTGISGLDDMTHGGIRKNRSTLLLGNAGCGKTMRTRSLCVMKSRGMDHSNEVRKFIISSKGITLTPIVAVEKRSKEDTRRNLKERYSLSTS
jgi:KaiC/GvpD/RAD55 family RecA-like ATPase